MPYCGTASASVSSGNSVQPRGEAGDFVCGVDVIGMEDLYGGDGRDYISGGSDGTDTDLCDGGGSNDKCYCSIVEKKNC